MITQYHSIVARKKSPHPVSVTLDGVSGTYIYQADNAGHAISGDADFRVKATLSSYTSASRAFFAKYGGLGARMFIFWIQTDGTLRFSYTTDGSTVTAIVSTAAVSTLLSTSEEAWFRVTVDADNGASGADFAFYVSTTNEASWTQLGSTVTGGSTISIADVNYTLEVGSRIGGTSLNMDAIFKEAKLMDGIDGTVKAHWKASAMGASSGPDSAPTPLGTWTMAGGYTVNY